MEQASGEAVVSVQVYLFPSRFREVQFTILNLVAAQSLSQAAVSGATL